ncbi:hypothetical protein [Clostridium estertheticum]|uniref:hypothetical protein n=1 Tax=Clostridium estertheticum TaxID=238834 RepID=UPI001CF3E8AA|nr:hypothetical protein [Clostridium estertheticum]MCB2353870.1 hypothetical protein [Clostridium estertheticum]WAG40433.1 hypothetical protein LL065_19580 [Clostridium estertheticum]
MELVYYLVKSAFILLGIISLLVGKYQSLKIIMSKKEKYKVIDERNYVKYSRLPFYVLGFYYILLGIVLLFINWWPTMIICFGPIIIVIPLSVISRKRRKCIERINV